MESEAKPTTHVEIDAYDFDELLSKGHVEIETNDGTLLLERV